MRTHSVTAQCTVSSTTAGRIVLNLELFFETPAKSKQLFEHMPCGHRVSLKKGCSRSTCLDRGIYA